ncbi:MAG TPA: tripartite tricarboxylate transporter substrate binding protein [Xanthobacteraceae bacterium]|jgi:tripartite-type tricarboxylate transporter receptor subunit TctC|nr:tripartite tricarboxylate transporter substrate binding protein [Xanthobacteraceae bacterium]
MRRRKFLGLAAGAAAVPAVSRIAWVLDYPVRPVHILVGFAPGSATDILARMMAQRLSERLGQSFVVDNRPGAGGNIATEAAVNAPADGYTLLMTSGANTINPTLYEKLSFDFLKDTTPVAGVTRSPLVMEVNNAVPAKTVPEFIAYTKANPGRVNMASSGIGTSLHISGELFKMMTGANMTHVPYRSAAAALTDLMGGQVQVLFDVIASSLSYVKAGQVRALAVTSASRSDALPGVPTVGEFVPGYEASACNGLVAPRNTPAEIVTKLNKAVNDVLAEPAMRAQLADLGATELTGPAAEWGALLSAEVAKWAKVVKFSGAKAE